MQGMTILYNSTVVRNCELIQLGISCIITDDLVLVDTNPTTLRYSIPQESLFLIMVFHPSDCEE